MKITLNRVNDDYLFECKNSIGNTLFLDNIRNESATGVSPMESLLMAVAGCSGIDVVSILKKQKQDIKQFSAEVEGVRIEEGDAKPFKSIVVKFFLEGNIDGKKLYRAAQLSFEKYCSVSKTLNPSIAIAFQVFLNGEQIKEI